MMPTQDVPPPISRPATRTNGCGAFGFLGMIAYLVVGGGTYVRHGLEQLLHLRGHVYV